jgi:hypothetical protein
MPIEHVVEQGETTIGLSEQYGVFAEMIWNDPANAELRQKRNDMNVLMPGDKLVIPDKRSKEVSKPPERKHRFRRRGVPAKFRLQVFDFEEPRANQNYQLVVDGKLLKGKTDRQGVLQEYVSPWARTGELTIGPDGFRIEIDFGYLDPIDELAGVQQRLNNLGFFCGEADGELDEDLGAALREFQGRFGLKQTGKVDPATAAKLEDVHDRNTKLPEPPADT